MSTFSATGIEERETLLWGVPVRIRSYAVGSRYSCRVDNIDPGDNIARAVGDTRFAAEQAAMEAARLTLELRRSREQMKRVTSSVSGAQDPATKAKR